MYRHIHLVSVPIQLKKLMLQGNVLTTLPRGLGHLSSLAVLSVGENHLQGIPEEVGEC